MAVFPKKYFLEKEFGTATWFQIFDNHLNMRVKPGIKK
jgi:hypothetical protein